MRSPLAGVRSGFRESLLDLHGDGRGWTLAAVATGWFVTLSVRFLLSALLPQVKATFAIDNATAGLAITVLWGCYALMQFPAGWLVDRLTERTLLGASLGGAAVSLALMGLAPVFGAFLVTCALLGLVNGLYGPARGTVISRVFADRDTAAFGVVLAAGSVGSALVPLAGGLVVGSLGWRGTLWLVVPAFLGAGLLVRATVPPGAAGSATAVTPDRATLRTVRRAVARRAVLAPVAAVTLMLFVFQGLTAFLPTYLVEVRGYSPGVAAALFAVLFLGGAGSQVLVGGLADRVGDRPVLVAVAAVSVVSVAALPFLEGLVPLGLLMGALGLRLAVAPVTNAYVVDVLPASVRGTAWGLIRTSMFLLAATGSTVVGAFGDAGLFDEAFLVLAGISVVATGLYVLVPPR